MSRTKTGFVPFAHVVVAVGVMIGPIAASKARAGDYQVAYAIDAGGLRESGKFVECTYKTACMLIFEKTSIHVATNTFRVSDNHAHIVAITIYGKGNCCYFSDGDSEISLNGDEQVHKLEIFEGRKKAGNELVVNNKVGHIYLEFRDFH